jgi:mannosyltransferase
MVALALGLARPWLAAALFAVLPLTLRYAAEARGYSQAMFFALLATLLFLRLAREPSPWTAVFYGLALIAAIYTQPYAALPAGAHILWAVLMRKRKAALYSAAAAALAVLAFVPWFLWVHGYWRTSVDTGDLHFVATLKTPLMLFRELSGAGYWGSGLLLLLCILGAMRLRTDRPTRAFLLLLIAVPLAGVFAADAIFDYFLAARQLLWILPPAALLASAAQRPAGVVLAILLLAVSAHKSALYFASKEEDWDAAARALAVEVDRGACLALANPGTLPYLQLFAPHLSQAPCASNTIVAAITPYSSSRERTALLDRLAAEGCAKRSTRRAGGTTLVLLQK